MEKHSWKKPLSPLLIWIISLCCLFLYSPSLLAAGVQIHANLGFGEYVVPGRWTPLFIEVRGGRLSQAERLTIEVAKIDPMRKVAVNPCEFFYLDISGGVSRVQIPVFINESGNMIHLTVKSGKQVVAAAKINSRERVFPGHLVLTCDISSSLQQAISKSLLPREPVNTVPINQTELPTQGLNYDGVSALVLTDQGPILNPAQLAALRAWLPGGGTLVICNPRPGEEGLFSRLITQASSQAMKENSINELLVNNAQPGGEWPELADITQFGFGRIIRLSFSAIRENPAYWRQLLSLNPFEDAKRLTAGEIFTEDAIDELNMLSIEEEGKFELRLLIIIWSILGLALLYLIKPRKMRLHALLLFTLISIVSSIPLGGWISGLWHRGARLYTQALLLPAGGGVIFNSTTGLPKDSFSWNLRLNLGEAEKGEINRYKSYCFWQHSLSTPIGLLQTGSDSEMTITGVLPVDQNLFSNGFWDSLSTIVPSGCIGLYNGEAWRQLQKDEAGQVVWQVQAGEIPDWVRNKDLIKRLHQFFPDYNWVYGLSSLPSFHLKLEYRLCNEVFWVTPVRKGVEL